MVNKDTEHRHFFSDVFARLEKMEVAPSLDGNVNGSGTSKRIVPWFACSVTLDHSYWKRKACVDI
jgi:hypothetical protein